MDDFFLVNIFHGERWVITGPICWGLRISEKYRCWGRGESAGRGARGAVRVSIVCGEMEQLIKLALKRSLHTAGAPHRHYFY